MKNIIIHLTIKNIITLLFLLLALTAFGQMKPNLYDTNSTATVDAHVVSVIGSNASLSAANSTITVITNGPGNWSVKVGANVLTNDVNNSLVQAPAGNVMTGSVKAVILSGGGNVMSNSSQSVIIGVNNVLSATTQTTVIGTGIGISNGFPSVVLGIGGPALWMAVDGVVHVSNGMGISNIPASSITGPLVTTFPTNTVVGFIQIGLKFGTTNLFIPCVYTNQ